MRHILLWYRNDLRTVDNPALDYARHNGDRVTALFVNTPQQWRSHHLSQRRIEFTDNAVKALRQELSVVSVNLETIEVASFAEVPAAIGDCCRRLDVDSLVFNEEYAVNEVRRDQQVTSVCRELGVSVSTFHGSLIIPPHAIKTAQGLPYKIFTPFKRAWLQKLADYLPAPTLFSTKKQSKNVSVAHELPAQESLQQSRQMQWPATEQAAQQRLQHFLSQQIQRYDQNRDLPALAATSTLSPYLSIGIISPLRCLREALAWNHGDAQGGNGGVQAWINELIWREFYLHIMAAFPQVCCHQPLRPETNAVPWRTDEREFDSWCQGITGYPLVDAAMRQLNQQGWMHNRLRMVTATFLTKYLLIDWRWGERYFMEQLIDGHLASNNGGWQWCASTGTDAAPYFRILSPIRQTQRFDPDARFIKHYVPELRPIDAKIIHQPGHPQLLATGYPPPMVDLAEAKQRCLDAFKFATNN